MISKSTIWFFVFSSIAEPCFCNSTTIELYNDQNQSAQITGAISLSISTTPASCYNTNGSITINATGGSAPLSYSIDNGVSFQASNLFNGLDSGNYPILVKDSNGQTAGSIVSLAALPTPKVSLGSDTTLCTGSTLSLAVPQQAGYTYLWSDNSTGYSYTVTKAGDYSLKVTNQYGCYVSTSINVLFKPTNLFSLGNDTTLCNGRNFQLKPNPSLPGTYLWSNGSTNTFISIKTPGVYWLKITDSGCIKKDSVIINYKGNPQITLGPDTSLCTGQSLLLDASLQGSVYDWQDGSSSLTFLVNQPGMYSVKVTNGGCDTTVQIKVDYLTAPSLFGIKDTIACLNRQLVLNAAYPNSSYLWQDGSTLPELTVTQAGKYSVAVTNPCGTTKESATVRFENCLCQIAVPNAFTPNGDGRNDIFLPKSPCPLGEFEFKIYNRLGQLIFSSKNFSLGWDGRYANQQQPTGTYVWELDYSEYLNGRRIHKKGTVTLIR